MHQNKNLYGLVLIGGKSSRMQRDKSLINYHGIAQREYIYQALDKLCSQTFYSCRKEQASTLPSSNIIIDQEEHAGPLKAIQYAFQYNSKVAWLVVACDLPLLKQETIKQLIAKRNPSKIATTFASPHDQKPEPLISIWEPSSEPIITTAINKGMLSPRKILLENSIELLNISNKEILSNINTPDEYNQIINKLHRL